MSKLDAALRELLEKCHICEGGNCFSCGSYLDCIKKELKRHGIELPREKGGKEERRPQMSKLDDVLREVSEKTRLVTLDYTQSRITDKQLYARIDKLNIRAKQQIGEMVKKAIPNVIDKDWVLSKDHYKWSDHICKIFANFDELFGMELQREKGGKDE